MLPAGNKIRGEIGRYDEDGILRWHKGFVVEAKDGYHRYAQK
jgi:hypothetical protein